VVSSHRTITPTPEGAVSVDVHALDGEGRESILREALHRLSDYTLSSRNPVWLKATAQGFFGGRRKSTPPCTAAISQNPVRSRRVLSMMVPVSKGSVQDPGGFCNRCNRLVREGQLREVVEVRSNRSKLVLSMKALDDALEVWDGLHWLKIKMTMIQKVVEPLSTEKLAPSHK
jgi:hypothetical protein